MGKILVFRTKAQIEQERKELVVVDGDPSLYMGLKDLFTDDEIDKIRKDLEADNEDV